MIRRALGRLSDALAGGLIFLARGYQATLSPWLGRQCRFVPTCSNYFIQAVAAHGPFRGLALGIRRLLRCHPFCRGGYDPVPPAPAGRRPRRADPPD